MEKYEKESFIILGSGCEKCNKLEKNLKEALNELRIEENIEHITEPALISMYGVMKTPALVIQSKVVSIGKVPTIEEIKELSIKTTTKKKIKKRVIKMTETAQISFFDKYLTIWVIICMIIGILISQYLPIIPQFLNQFEYAQISIPMAILIWIMIYPMMLKIDFKSILRVKENLRGIILTWCVNWLFQPFSMYVISLLFFTIIYAGIMTPTLATQYLIGAVLLGSAPCTAMVFVWSELTNGDPAYTLVQVATNDIIILFAYVPIVTYLLGISDITIPYDTLLLSVILFVVIPFIASIITRKYIISHKSQDYLENKFIPKFNNITTIGLLLTLIFIFSFQGNLILTNPLDIILIAIPFTIQIFLVFTIGYLAAKLLKIPQNIAAPGSMVGASNFFELAVAIAIALYGIGSPVALATTVGVLIEVPIMLTLVKIINNTKDWYNRDSNTTIQ